MYYLIYRDASNQWRWTLYAANGRKIANCGEGYVNKQHCRDMIDVVAGSSGTPVRYA